MAIHRFGPPHCPFPKDNKASQVDTGFGKGEIPKKGCSYVERMNISFSVGEVTYRYRAGGYLGTKPMRTAYKAAWVRLDTPSFINILLT